MGLLEYLRQIFRKKSREEALQSDVEALQKRFKALKSAPISEEKTVPELTLETPRISSSIEIQKDSLQLGVAAGYAGRALKEIESSLGRIEAQMVTKDWFVSQFEDKTPELINLFKIHEQNEQKRFEALQSAFSSLKKTAEKTPEPFKTELFQQIRAIERQLPLTPKMKEILQIVKEVGEISYEDLAKKLNLTEVSGLRGLLSTMVKRTNEIERFEKDRKGWIRYKAI